MPSQYAASEGARSAFLLVFLCWSCFPKAAVVHGNLPLVSAEMMALCAGRIGASGVVVGISHTFHAIFVHDESLMTSRALSNGKNCTQM
jgi:hypothetical protein